MTLRSKIALSVLIAALPAAAQAADLRAMPRSAAPAAPAATGYIVTVTGDVQGAPRFPGSEGRCHS